MRFGLVILKTCLGKSGVNQINGAGIRKEFVALATPAKNDDFWLLKHNIPLYTEGSVMTM